MSTTHIEQIKSRIDIVAFISEYIPSKPAGSNYKALCPFHNEKTPSFIISSTKQRFKCFGCGKSGDVFTFLQEYEGMTFPEAVAILAKQAGVSIPRFDAEVHTKENRLYDCMRSAALLYNLILTRKKEGAEAGAYISRRGIDELTRDTFLLGWSTENWNTVYTFLRNKGFTDEIIRASGLVTDGTKGYYDRFRSRIMFPIWDLYGRVVGFGGRILTDDTEQAKYINTARTPIYDKSCVLYGLDKAKDSIRKEGAAIIVEGYMDVIASHQNGVKHVVAASGTALTKEQLQLLKRFTHTVIFAFDMDEAGIKAAIRSYLLATSLEMNTKVVQLPFGKDPCDIAQEDPVMWRALTKQGQHVMDYYFSVVLRGARIHELEDKKRVRDALFPVISQIADPVEYAHYAERLATLLRIPFESFKRPSGARQKAASSLMGDGEKGRDSVVAMSPSPIISSVNCLFALVSKYARKVPLSVMLPDIPFHSKELFYLYKDLRETYNAEITVERESLELWKERHREVLEEYILLADKEYADIDDREVQLEFSRLREVLSRYVMKAKQDKLISAIKRAEERDKDDAAAEKLTVQLNTLISQ